MPFADDLLEQAYHLAQREAVPKQASLRRAVSTAYSDGKPDDRLQLKDVARAFIQLQEQRHTADYDNSFEWLETDVAAALTLATDAFADWRAIRTQNAAQDYLLSLFLPKLLRQ